MNLCVAVLKAFLCLLCFLATDSCGVVAGEPSLEVRNRILKSFDRKPCTVEVSSTITMNKEGQKREFKLKGRYRSDGDRHGYLSDESVGNRIARQEALYWKGEIVRVIEHSMFSQSAGGSQISSVGRLFHYESTKANPEIRPTLGAILFDTHCPAIGCIDGYFLRDYFPDLPQTVVESVGDRCELKSTTLFGTATCVVDTTRGYVVTGLIVSKSESQYASSGRVLGTIKYDESDPKSSLVSKTIFVKDCIPKADDSGGFYVERCTVLVENVSKRGKEDAIETLSLVTSFDSKPKRHSPIVPELEIIDGQRFQAIGAEQLPFAWSSSEKWVVPNAGVYQTAVKSNRSSVFLLSVLAIGSFGLFWWFFRRKSS